ncbi:MAG: 3-deoxy-manno-octulosonate cytidylyltransferase [Methylobacillus sp.]|jgi:3-deoxy-manno-octulosonate cytidylyltransferase (CMP-KDO synthetase)|nr:3-deoxy-manno-octulosonate cytidylyltransferase [Methylobacillus sp.]
MALRFKVVIPARFASTRLPGKPLLDIAGKPMIVHVAEKARASGAEEVVIATDDERILQTAQSHGHQAVMTRVNHVSGTDRIAEVAAIFGWADDTIIVNVQGDEPLIAPELVREVAQNLADHKDAAIATACHPIHDRASVFNPNIVKVVTDHAGYALYFSRAPIPYERDIYADNKREGTLSQPAFRHIGIYAYKAAFLKICSRLEASPIEKAESLEQLRALWHGYRISVAVTANAPATGVDTAEDLERVRRCLDNAKNSCCA